MKTKNKFLASSETGNFKWKENTKHIQDLKDPLIKLE